MEVLRAILYLFLLHFHLGLTTAAKQDKVLLSSVQTLTLRAGRQTTHRRVAAVPQLRCVGGNARGLYEVDVLRCANAGSSYAGGPDVEWTCTAALPPEFRLGSTDVVCEGYASSADPHVLAGSCGVEYRLVLTKRGEERYGKRRAPADAGAGAADALSGTFTALFWALFICVAAWIAYNAFVRATDNAQRRPRRPNGRSWGGGWGGGGGGGGGGGPPDDPPPPYDFGSKPTGSHSSPRARGGAWNPGFWTGAAGGAAAGYAAANWRNGRGNDGGEGSSRSASGGAGFSASRYESTGFGSTSRR